MNIPVSFGSQQQRLLRRGIRDGMTLEQACEYSGYDIATARLIAADDLKNPPPEEAYVLLYDPDARAAASNPKEDDMGRMAREPKEDREAGEGGGVSGEYQRADAAKAFEIYEKQIAPKDAHINTLKGDLSQPWDDIKEQTRFPKPVLKFILSLEGLEDAKRDHFLLALSDGLKHRRLCLPRDLVTMALGEDGDDVIPVGDRNPSDDLATLEDDEDETEELFEASEAELAQQRDRRSVQEAQAEADREAEAKADGTGAVARRAMNAAAAPRTRRAPKTAPDLSVVH